MNRFATLLQREWMQHQTGWLVTMALPLMVVVALGLLGPIEVELGDSGEGGGPPTPLLLALGVVAVVAVLTMALAWGASVIMSPGLARRDTQDRSIEFWLSLPVSHPQSLAATLLMHLLVVPWLALAVGAAGGVLASLLLVTRVFGAGEWLALPWGAMLGAGLGMGLRLALGLLLATLWLSPLILLTMAASAWLKRWGLPVVVGLVIVGGNVLDRVYGSPVIWEALHSLFDNASRALIVSDRGAMARSVQIENPEDIPGVLGLVPGWALEDAGHALMSLAQPAFVLALLGAAAGFGLLWLRRQRGA